MLTYGDLDQEKINRFVRAPMFPAWCARMEARMQQAVAELHSTFETAIKADIEAMKERKRQCSSESQ